MSDTEMRTGTADKAARLDELLDRQDILDCLHRVSRGIDRFDRDLFLSAFHDDALIDIGAAVADATTVYDGGKAAHETGQNATQHHITNHVCDIEGDSAHSETYILYCGNNCDGTNLIAGVRYLDRLERRDDQWRIAFRKILIEWSSLVDALKIPVPENIADIQLNGVASRSREDASYRRPLMNFRTLPNA